jgi:short-subunit dehydrogenase
MNLKEKIVVITGSTLGFGKELAILFKNEGARVVINSNKEDEVNKVSGEMGVLGICADVSKEEELNALLNKVIENYGGIDIWINNAGLWIPHSFAEDTDMEKVRKMFEVNVFGLMNGSRVALRKMKEKGSGMIINIISDSALAPRPMSSMYSASKWAVNGFTKSIRDENDKLKVLSIFPGPMKTEIFGDKKPDNFDDFMEVEYVAEKIISNLKNELPEDELIIQKK